MSLLTGPRRALLAKRAAPAPAPPATIYWINHRATLAGPTGFPGDAPGDSYSTGDVHPTGRTVNGYGFGWDVDGSADASNYTDFAAKPHQAGRIASTGVRKFIIDGLTVGLSYKLHVSQGAIGSGVGCGYRLLRADASTPYAGTNINVTVPGGSFMDAMGNIFASPDLWAAGEVGFAFTALDTSIQLYRGSTNGSYWNAIGIEPPL